MSSDIFKDVREDVGGFYAHLKGQNPFAAHYPIIPQHPRNCRCENCVRVKSDFMKEKKDDARQLESELAAANADKMQWVDQAEKARDELAALNLAYNCAMRVGIERAKELQATNATIEALRKD